VTAFGGRHGSSHHHPARGLAILGFAVKGLLWLAILGIVFFVITLIVGWLRRGASRG
jgi:hypothetical protein